MTNLCCALLSTSVLFDSLLLGWSCLAPCPHSLKVPAFSWVFANHARGPAASGREADSEQGQACLTSGLSAHHQAVVAPG